MLHVFYDHVFFTTGCPTHQSTTVVMNT